MSIKVEYRYGVTLEQARERMRALGDYFHNRHGMTITWDASGDRVTVKGKYMVVSFEGTMVLEDGLAMFEGKDPGFLLRGKAKDYLHGKLTKYLDPKTPLDQLPRR